MKKLLLVILALLAVGATAYVLNERRRLEADPVHVDDPVGVAQLSQERI